MKKKLFCDSVKEMCALNFVWELLFAFYQEKIDVVISCIEDFFELYRSFIRELTLLMDSLVSFDSLLFNCQGSHFSKQITRLSMCQVSVIIFLSGLEGDPAVTSAK